MISTIRFVESPNMFGEARFTCISDKVNPSLEIFYIYIDTGVD